jgi:hypothetical protein
VAADIDTNSSVPVVEGMQIRTSRATKTQAAPPRIPGRFRDDSAIQGRGAFWRRPGGVATGPPGRPIDAPCRLSRHSGCVGGLPRKRETDRSVGVGQDQDWTENSRHLPGTPFNPYSP